MEGWEAVMDFLLSVSGENLWIQVQVRLVDCLQLLADWQNHFMDREQLLCRVWVSICCYDWRVSARSEYAEGS